MRYEVFCFFFPPVETNLNSMKIFYKVLKKKKTKKQKTPII